MGKGSASLELKLVVAMIELLILLIGTIATLSAAGCSVPPCDVPLYKERNESGAICAGWEIRAQLGSAASFSSLWYVRAGCFFFSSFFSFCDCADACPQR